MSPSDMCVVDLTEGQYAELQDFLPYIWRAAEGSGMHLQGARPREEAAFEWENE